ncbi:MAG: hypothetical protein IT494_09015 [Gammaproteobacteria bacterium]|nr:hypothetical protein [Gammaproteobacteria bacterium]
MVSPVLAAALSAGALISASALAQTRDSLTGNAVNNGSTVKQVIAALEKTAAGHPAYADQLRRGRKNIGLVFVPGILGSTLESKSAGGIWGFGLPDADKLVLPRELIDPAAASDVQARLAESVAGLTLYGEAMKKIRASAAKAGISEERIVACGYDWRRDIRAGAEDLHRCIVGAPQLKDADALVIVAHSMGGVVTWAWHGRHAADGEMENGVRILALAVLGSPLGGSCEMVRMVQTGYVQPEADEQYVRGTWFSRRWNDIKGMKDRVVNVLSGAISDSIRPVVLTWPGAIGLTPPPARTLHETNCALLPSNPNDLADQKIVTHYMPAFWTGPLGADILGSAQLPATYAEVLAQAQGFREAFKPETLASPAYLYASQLWVTPAQAPVDPTDNYRLAKTAWVAVPGDGRVPLTAAIPEGVEAAEARPLASVHGNLPEDDDFHAAFFGERLPRVLDAWAATQVMARAADDGAFLKDYLGQHGPFANPSDFYTAFEPDRGTPARYGISNDSRDLAIAFNDALCAQTAACAGYTTTRGRTQAAASNAAKASLYSASMRSGSLSDDDAAIVIAQRGLAMALDRNWSAAISDLRDGVARLEARRKRKGRESESEKQLRIAAYANLGRALAVRGFCADAKSPLALGAAGGSELARKAQAAPCYDRESGRIVPLIR